MSRRVAIATCEEVRDLDADARVLAAALERRGAEVRPVVWDRGHDPFTPDAADAVLIRSTWDYPSRPELFLRWAQRQGERLYNSVDVVRWNIDKRYLADLRDGGLPVVPSTFVPPDHGEVGDVGDIAFPAGRFVVKPTVSAGSKDTAVYDGERLDAATRHVRRLHADGRCVLVQPYLPAVETAAETAVVLVDGRPCHAMRKGPLLELDQPFEDSLFRQEQMQRREASAEETELAFRACSWVAERFGMPLYARVDMLRDALGHPVILELELIEPSLFLDFCPSTADALADALLARLGS